MQITSNLNNLELNTPQKTNSVDMLLVLRAFACVLVIIMHSLITMNNKPWFTSNTFHWSLFSPAWVGMWIFFVLSGYLMGKGFFTNRYSGDLKGAVNFYINRAIRILPLYYFSIFLIIVFLSPELLNRINWDILFKLFTFTFNGVDYSVGSAGFINGALWSISTECQYYLCVPFLFIFLSPLLKSKKIIYFFISLLLISGFIFRVFFTLKFYLSNGSNFEFWWYIKGFVPFTSNLDVFLTGFLLNALIKVKKTEVVANKNKFFENIYNFRKYFAVLLMIAVYIIFAYVSFNALMLHKSLYLIFWVTAGPSITIMTTAFFIYTFEKENIIHGIKNSKISFQSIKQNPLRVIEIFGILTYGLYIWHSPILSKTALIFKSSVPIFDFLIKFSVAMLFGTMLSAITYIAIEKPLEKYKKFGAAKK